MKSVSKYISIEFAYLIYLDLFYSVCSCVSTMFALLVSGNFFPFVSASLCGIFDLADEPNAKREKESKYVGTVQITY